MTATARAAAPATGAAYGKAHDQGVSDGSSPPGTGDFVKSLDGPGASGVTGGGARGAAASDAKDDNRRDPVDRPGQAKKHD